jgi:hypothetical protein
MVSDKKILLPTKMAAKLKIEKGGMKFEKPLLL